MTDDGKAMERPPPPPEAALIRLVRDAAGLKIPAVAGKAGISPARWSQIENGYESRKGRIKPVTGKAVTLAHMAHAVGISPERLEATGTRGAEAAVILREIAAWKDPIIGERTTDATVTSRKPPDADGTVRPSYVVKGRWLEDFAREIESEYRLLPHSDVMKVAKKAEEEARSYAATLERERELEAEVHRLRGVTNGS